MLHLRIRHNKNKIQVGDDVGDQDTAAETVVSRDVSLAMSQTTI